MHFDKGSGRKYSALIPIGAGFLLLGTAGDYSHFLLLFAVICAVLVYLRVEVLGGVPLSRRKGRGLIALLSVCICAAGLQYPSGGALLWTGVYCVLLASTVMLAGRKAAQYLFLPMTLPFFIVPPVQEGMELLTPLLSRVMTHLADLVLEALFVSFPVSGEKIHPGATRYLFSLIIIGFIYAESLPVKIPLKVALLAMVVPIAIGAEVMRMVSMGFLSVVYGESVSGSGLVGFFAGGLLWFGALGAMIWSRKALLKIRL